MKINFNNVILCVTILVGAWLLGSDYKNRFDYQNNISVTGLGTRDFTSDLITWSASFNRLDMDLKNAYKLLDADRELVKKYLMEKGVREDEMVFSSVDYNKETDTWYDNSNNRHSNFLGYRLTQSVKIQSKRVNEIENISREVTELINQGVELTSSAPEFFYTKLAELKLEMVAQATEDATKRARKIAENAGARLDGLKNATMGIFQITGQNSSEDYSWGGTFNTYAKEKTASITMKLEFGVR